MNRVGFFLISDKEEYHFCYCDSFHFYTINTKI